MTREDLSKKTVAELRALADLANIELPKKAKKEEIIDIIMTPPEESVPGEEKTEDAEEKIATVEEIPEENISQDKEASSQEQEQTETVQEKQETKTEEAVEEETKEGILEIKPEGYGFLRMGNYLQSERDIFVPATLIKNLKLREGDKIKGRIKIQKDKSNSLAFIYAINGLDIGTSLKRKTFESLTPVYPDEKYKLETEPKVISTRILDIFAPIGKGQRAMIVSPPKAGKTTFLKEIANSISKNYPETELMVLLIDERPEEVTDMKESIRGEVIYSTFDEQPERHVKVAELVYHHALRSVESGRDVVILLDSLTRLARAYNLTVTPTGRTLSGGLDPAALYSPKKFFGAARNIRGGGSLTIIATALVNTGSKMDDVIFEEFKGTGNMEVHLDRNLSDRRIFPAIDIIKSGTRKEELLLSEKEINIEYELRRLFAEKDSRYSLETLVDEMREKETNEQFLEKYSNLLELSRKKEPEIRAAATYPEHLKTESLAGLQPEGQVKTVRRVNIGTAIRRNPQSN